jgi:hypothetical protein
MSSIFRHFKSLINRIRMFVMFLFIEQSLRNALKRAIKHFRHAFLFRQLWTIEHLDANGNVIWRQTQVPNALADEGENNILDVYYRGQNAPTTFYCRLYNDTPLETDSLADLTGEPVGNGYAAQEIERSTVGWPTLALDAGDWQLTSKEVTFTASGGSWGPVTHAVLATSSDNSGLLIAFVALSTSRTLQDGETLKVTIQPKQQ